MRKVIDSLRSQIELLNLNPPVWEEHELGCPNKWPVSLKALVGTMLLAPTPAYICWGESKNLIFNKAYQPLLGDRAEAAFGQRFAEVWPELGSEFSPLFSAVAEGKNLVFRDHFFKLERKGYEEDTYFDFSLSPVCDSEGYNMGLQCFCNETTDRFIANKNAAAAVEERRIESERSLLNQEWLAATLRGIGDAVIATDSAAIPKIVYLNPIAEKLTGWTTDDANGVSVYEVFNIVHETTRLPAKDPIKQVLNSGQEATLANHTVLISSSGEEYFIEDSASPIRRADGTMHGVVVVFRDVTEKHAIEKLVASTQADLIDTLESMSDAFFTLDKDWTMVGINKHMVRMLGKPLDEMLGKNLITTFFNSQELQEIKFVKEYRRALHENIAITFEEFYAPFNIWLRVRAYPKANGGLAVFFTDITEAKRYQLRLIESEEHFRDLANAAPQIIWTADGDGSVDYANSRWYEFTGLSPEQTMGSGFTAIIHPDDLEQTLRSYGEAIATMKPMEIQHRFKSGIDGTYRWFIIRALPKLEMGVVKKWYGTITDIHEQKSLTEELIKSRDEADLANQTKSSFLANMSHEIRTPLGAIIGFAELLRDADLSEHERQDYLDTVIRNGKGLTKIIDDILDLAKVEMNKLDIENVEFSLLQLINDVLDLFRERVRAKQIYLRTHFDTEIPSRIISDPTRIRQILINIIGNAIKFTEEGGVTIVITSALLPNDRSEIKFSVGDTGIGISDEEKLRLFQPFVQADNSTTRKFGGTGLGLVISKRLAEAMGGRISVENQVQGSGSTFAITIVVQLAIKRSPKPASPNDKPGPNKQILEGYSVLVADDSPDNQILIQKILKKHGASSTLASDGLEAFRTAIEEIFDFILMDIQMPKMDGYEATKALREAGVKTPIIALTAHAMAEERARSAAAGCNGHLTKPINQAELIETIMSLIAKFSIKAQKVKE